MPCLRCCQRSGGLLPHRFTLTVLHRLRQFARASRLQDHVKVFPSDGHRGVLHRRSIFCGTVRSRNIATRLRKPTKVPAPWRYQARCPTVSGLSSRPALLPRRPSDHPACPPIFSIARKDLRYQDHSLRTHFDCRVVLRKLRGNYQKYLQRRKTNRGQMRKETYARMAA